MRQYKRQIIIAVVLIAMFAFITNPTQTDFERHLAQGARNQIGLIGEGAFPQIVNMAIHFGVNNATTRSDYKLFSVYRMDIPEQENDQRYLGVFGNFVSL